MVLADKRTIRDVYSTGFTLDIGYDPKTKTDTIFCSWEKELKCGPSIDGIEYHIDIEKVFQDNDKMTFKGTYLYRDLGNWLIFFEDTIKNNLDTLKKMAVITI